MHEIICPNCKKAFKIDETGYADILKQVRDREFEKQLNARLELAEKEKLIAVELEKTKVTSELDKRVAVKDAEIQELRSRLEANDISKKLAINEAVNAIEKERDSLKNGLKRNASTPFANLCKKLASRKLNVYRTRRLLKIA